MTNVHTPANLFRISRVAAACQKTSRPSLTLHGEPVHNLFTVPELRALAKEKGKTGYSKLKRDDLLNLLNA